MPRKTKVKENIDFSKINASNTPVALASAEAQVNNYTMALITSIVPVFFWTRIRSLDFMDNILFYVIVTVLSTVLLSLSYTNVSNFTNVQLSYTRRQAPVPNSKISKQKLAQKQSENTSIQSLNWSYAQNNFVFYVIFLLFTFYFTSSVSPVYSNTISVLVAAVANWQLSTTFIQSS